MSDEELPERSGPPPEDDLVALGRPALMVFGVLLALLAIGGVVRLLGLSTTPEAPLLQSLEEDDDGQRALGSDLDAAVDIAVGPDGLVHIALAQEDPRVRRIDPDGTLATVVTTTVLCPDGGGCDIGPIAFDSGRLHAVAPAAGQVRTIDGTGAVVGVAATGGDLILGEVGGLVVSGGRALLSDRSEGRIIDVEALRVLVSGLDEPLGLAVDLNDTLHVAAASGRVVRILDGEVETAVGRAGPGENASIDDPEEPIVSPADVAFDLDGTMWIADPGSATVRYVLTAGAVRTVEHGFEQPVALDVAPDGSVYVLDMAAPAAVYRISSDLDVELIAGQR